ncbi:MAG: cbb3-type cytochrome c oxidase subunit I, partial [Deltaproteobacteria bacterium]|nr:cbb3-type cytochrome c oxidase subunit I [Deltaproteobacteria bacterium]
MKFLKVEPHGTAKLFYLSSAFWFLMGALEGLLDAAHLTAPELVNNVAWLVFGRVRPMHTSTMIVGFVGSALLAAPHYYLPTLLKTPLFSERLGKLSLWVWNLSIAAGTATLALGHSQSREYAEWIWPVDVGVLLAFALIAVNFALTGARRKE